MSGLILFLAGVLTGVSLCTILLYLIGKKLVKKVATELDNKSKSNDEIEEKLERVKAITAEQISLMRQSDGPQRNSMDGKYKNSIYSKMKILDEEKHELLKSILMAGHDPQLTTMDEDGVVEKMRLSEYMDQMGYSRTPAESKIDKKPAFKVYDGGKFDENDDDDDGTVH